jgi:dipeptidyl-peptidase 4
MIGKKQHLILYSKISLTNRTEVISVPTTNSPAHFTIADIAVFPAPGMGIPSHFNFSHDGRWLYYLDVIDPTSPIQQLYMADTTTGELRIAVTPPTDGSHEDLLSPEEELRRQRERMLATGITHYQCAVGNNRILIPYKGNIYIQDDSDAPLRIVFDATGKPPARDPALSPSGTHIAFVQDAELYVIPTKGGKARQITHGARGTGKTNGLAEYIAEEELDRHEGFWWSPDNTQIAYTEVDDTHIPLYRIQHLGKDATEDTIEEIHHYPFAGAQNAKVRLGVVSIKGGAPIWLDLTDLEDYYIARVFWWEPGIIGAEILNRPQTTVDLVRIDVATGTRTTVLHETNDAWISARRQHFLHLQDGSFLWASEQSGFNHIYLYDHDGTLVRQLTAGEWQVDSIEAVDETNGLVYFTGNREDPRERHLYAIPLAGGNIRRITDEAGMHDVTIDVASGYFVDVFSSMTTPPTVVLQAIDATHAPQILHMPDDPRLAKFELEAPELVTLQNRDGTPLYGALYRPSASFGPGPYPTIISLYGGPGPQMVTNSWGMTASLQRQYLRSLGFAVFTLDNRGSARRGLEFERAIKNRMGTIEVEDQVDGVRWLITQGITDPQRVGMTGWSYGGFMTLMCLEKAADIFKVGVAGAPATTFAGYDTCYTERYMGTPQENPAGYAATDATRFVETLKGKLLLIHGMIDENVHFRHTARFIEALVQAGKPYDIVLLPEERHSPRMLSSRVYYQERLIEYFKEWL